MDSIDDYFAVYRLLPAGTDRLPSVLLGRHWAKVRLGDRCCRHCSANQMLSDHLPNLVLWVLAMIESTAIYVFGVNDFACLPTPFWNYGICPSDRSINYVIWLGLPSIAQLHQFSCSRVVAEAFLYRPFLNAIDAREKTHCGWAAGRRRKESGRRSASVRHSSKKMQNFDQPPYRKNEQVPKDAKAEKARLPEWSTGRTDALRSRT